MLDADRVVAVIGKTEGNGGVNDYTRIIADRAFREVLVANGTRTPEQVEGGADRLVRRHRRRAQPARDRVRHHPTPQPSDEPRLTVGFAMSEQIRPEDIGRLAMVEKVAAAVRDAMARAGITDPADVHYVQTKTPLLTIRHDPRREGARRERVDREHPRVDGPVQRHAPRSGSRVALGEIEMPDEAAVLHDRELFSSVASCSSGVELDRAQIVVVGNARGVGGRYRIGHAVMRDALDQDGIWAAIRDAGLDLPERPHPADLGDRLVNVFLKCEADPGGMVRGRRNAMLDDSDVHWHRQIKACVGGVAAAVTGDPAVFVSVSAVHQGPPGGGPVAAIVDLGG